VHHEKTLVDAAKRMMDADLKVTLLKSLQELVWEEGYRQGGLKG